MKRLTLGMTILVIGMLSTSVIAQELPGAGITPDSWLYGFDRFFERVQLFFTFDPAAKARLRLQFAGERIAEANEMVRRGKPEFVQDLMREHELELSEAEKEVEGLRAVGRNVTLLVEHISNVTYRHITVLEEVLEKSPEQAKPAIEHAINASMKEHETAIEGLSEDLPERATELLMRLAENRLGRANRKVLERRIEEAGKVIEDYERVMNKSIDMTEKTEGLGRNVTALAEHVCNMTYKHILVLERVLANVSEEAKPAIEHAINASMKGHENCMNRILRIINKSVEKGKWKACTSDEECEEILTYCPVEFGFEVKCHIPLNRTEGICHCWPKWRKLWINCTTDADCRNLICPMVIGSDTPICEANRCICGARWEMANRTEWRERFGEELTSEVQERIEKIEEMYNRTEIERRIEEMFPGMRR
ncbi:MAG: DUF5667 domain-containing protein [Candidatus Aenigmarchaeota archaeon]|nr:DUF5667 domain-containing protein [Candidatus Aenigmarchaeota archaeon]